MSPKYRLLRSHATSQGLPFHRMHGVTRVDLQDQRNVVRRNVGQFLRSYQPSSPHAGCWLCSEFVLTNLCHVLPLKPSRSRALPSASGTSTVLKRMPRPTGNAWVGLRTSPSLITSTQLVRSHTPSGTGRPEMPVRSHVSSSGAGKLPSSLAYRSTLG